MSTSSGISGLSVHIASALGHFYYNENFYCNENDQWVVPIQVSYKLDQLLDPLSLQMDLLHRCNRGGGVLPAKPPRLFISSHVRCKDKMAVAINCSCTKGP